MKPQRLDQGKKDAFSVNDVHPQLTGLIDRTFAKTAHTHEGNSD
jgi:hypothetical protein